LFRHHDTDPLNAIRIRSCRAKIHACPGAAKMIVVGLDGLGHACGSHAMPSLLRVLVVVGVVGGLGYAAMYALANYVGPKTREMSVTVPPDHFVKRQ
jgi:hypothetical protein